jgi:hypothetical protein
MELPIYRELQSAWFDSRQAPAPTSARTMGSADSVAADAAPVDVGAERDFPGDSGDGPDDSSADVRSASPADNGQPEFAAEADEHVPVTAPVAEPATVGAPAGGAGTTHWRTAADEGWRAASALSTEQDFAVTEKGLPKRVPMSQLVPGGVEKDTVTVQKRSPDAVRGLLSAYHRGVQRGRTNQKGAEVRPSEPSGTGPNNSQSGREQEA